jgi:hypothetical protein
VCRSEVHFQDVQQAWESKLSEARKLRCDKPGQKTPDTQRPIMSVMFNSRFVVSWDFDLLPGFGWLTQSRVVVLSHLALFPSISLAGVFRHFIRGLKSSGFRRRFCRELKETANGNWDLRNHFTVRSP